MNIKLRPLNNNERKVYLYLRLIGTKRLPFKGKLIAYIIKRK